MVNAAVSVLDTVTLVDAVSSIITDHASAVATTTCGDDVSAIDIDAVSLALMAFARAMTITSATDTLEVSDTLSGISALMASVTETPAESTTDNPDMIATTSLIDMLGDSDTFKVASDALESAIATLYPSANARDISVADISAMLTDEVSATDSADAVSIESPMLIAPVSEANSM
jgi:hypothetical protein